MNDRVVKNPNFNNTREFHTSLRAKGIGAKDYPNTHTEVEYLSNGKFAASIGVGHRVFFDKADGNKPKKHKLTDERPAKGYVLVQGAKCCVEVYPYYAKYFDVQHEEVRLYEERWVVQRLFKEPDTWRDVDAYNPQIAVEEYPEPAGDVVKVTVAYETDYGTLIVEYFQRDGNALKHNVTFKNTADSPETFRVLQRWAGIVGAKCNGKDIPVVEDASFFAFHSADKPSRIFNIAENLYSMIFNEDGTEKTDQCLQRPISIEAYAQGMKADFTYGNWILAQDESLTIDPDTATLDNPTVDGHLNRSFTIYSEEEEVEIRWGPPYASQRRGFFEWSISGIPDASTITDVVFKYHGKSWEADCHINEMLGYQPSLGDGESIWGEAGEGTVYADPDGFPIAATGQEVDLGPSADSDLQSQLSLDWFAIGVQLDSEDGTVLSEIYAEEYATADPKPTLYVEYTLVVGLENKSANMAAKMVAAGLI